MSPAKKVGGLEISEDLDFQRKEWNVERWGWIFMLILVIAALLGLFGQGPLSATSAENGGLFVRYNRFERLLAPTHLTVQLDQAMAQNRAAQNGATQIGVVRLRLDQSLLEAYNVETVMPEPESVELSSNGYTYVFKTSQNAQPPEIVFNLQPNRLGPASGEVSLDNGPAVQLRQFIYP